MVRPVLLAGLLAVILLELSASVRASAPDAIAQAAPVYDLTTEYPTTGPSSWVGWNDQGCAGPAGTTVPYFVEGYWTPGQFMSGFRVYYNVSGTFNPCVSTAVRGSSGGTQAYVCAPPGPNVNISSATAYYTSGGVYGITLTYTNSRQCSLGTTTMGTPGSMQNSGQIFGFFFGTQSSSSTSDSYITQIGAETFVATGSAGQFEQEGSE